MMTQQIYKYELSNFDKIIYDGFNFNLPEDTLKLITTLSSQVGSPSYVKTPVFRKRDQSIKSNAFKSNDNHLHTVNSNNGTNDGYNMIPSKNRKKNKNVEITNDAEWENLRSFHVTKIEEKDGIEGDISTIRSHLNKISEKNYNDTRDKILNILDCLVEIGTNNSDMLSVCSSIFDMASNNRFYSKLYAELFVELLNKYEGMKTVFQNSFDSFLELFSNIQYVDADVNYDQFCLNNKNNEKRKALSAFFINLMEHDVISKDNILDIIVKLLKQIFEFIDDKEKNKKNEVDEITENIAILCTKEMMELETVVLNDETLLENIRILANSKSKKYPNLSNKSIFKFMDMIEM